jgi:hypothetical protein
VVEQPTAVAGSGAFHRSASIRTGAPPPEAA